MDMIVRAILNARQNIEFTHAEDLVREDVDRVFMQSVVLQQAVTVAEELGCEKTDVAEARRLLADLTEQWKRSRAALRTQAENNIREQAALGWDVHGLVAVDSGSWLREQLEAAVTLINARRSNDPRMTLSVGESMEMPIEPDSVYLTERCLHAGGLAFPLSDIQAVRRINGLGMLFDETTMVQIFCAGATPGMPLDKVRDLRPGMRVVVLEPTTGQDAKDQERSYPAGTVGEVYQIAELPAPQGLSVTVIVGPQDSSEAIVNVFDESDTCFPLAPATTDAD